VPTSYGTNLAYFRQRAPLLGIADLWIKDSSGDNGEQYSEEPWWSSPDIFVDAPPYDGVPDFNPEFGQPNRVWARVWNRGDQSVDGVYVRYYWFDPAIGFAPGNLHLIPGTPGHPNPAGPFSIPAGSSSEAPYVEWTPTIPAHICLLAIAYINDDPRDSDNPDPLVYPFEMRWDNSIAVCEAAMLIELRTPNLTFNDVPEGETTFRAVVFSVQSFRAVTFEITSGPTVSSGPVGTSFGTTPLGTTITLDATTDFTTAEREARIWISYTGTSDGDTATGTVTIRCVETGEEWEIPISANTVSRPTVAVLLALDQSNSMNFDSGLGPDITRGDVLKFSAPPFVDVIRDGNAMGIITFDHDPHDLMGVTPTDLAGRITANGHIATYTPNPNGWTSIGEAVARAHDLLDPETGYDIKAMIVLTDGRENHDDYSRRYISDVADLINERVYAIGLGTAENIQPSALEALCNGHEGYLRMTGDLDIDAYFRLAKYYQQILAGVTNEDIIVDPEGWIKPGQTHRIPFRLNETDIGSDVILLTPAPYVFRFLLETPAGDVIDPSVASANPAMLYMVGNNVSFYRMTLPVPIGGSEAREGTWHAVLTINEPYYKRYLASLDNYPEWYQTTLAHGVRYSLTVHAYSNLRMRTSLSQNSYEPGATLTLRAVLTEYGLPVAGRASVRAKLERPDNTTTTLTLAEVEPGVFETSTMASMSGVYRFRVLGTGTTLRGRPFTREQTLTGAIWQGGDEPPPTSKDDPRKRDERLCQLLRCLLREGVLRRYLEEKGIDMKALEECLKVLCEDPRPTLGEGAVRIRPEITAVLSEPRVHRALISLLRASDSCESRA
jgi:Mg-chelatase subunit ChlD